MSMAFNGGLPFKVGQQAELITFEEGFRGAWFRCKIHDIRSQGDQTECLLEFFDFPDEDGYIDAQRESRTMLMLRPSFPPCYHQSQLPGSFPESDVVAIVHDTWKVGDLVDWSFDGCYWSGAITDVLEHGKVKVKLHEPPVGEGKSYDAFVKDLRPSLRWFPEQGWTEPITEHCARVVRSFSEVTMYEKSGNEGEFIEESMPSNEENDSPNTSSPLKDRFNLSAMLIGSDPVPSAEDADTIESSILKLEELANKLRWIKGFLKFGYRWLEEEMKPSWIFTGDERSLGE
ncbi:Agenet domain plant type domain-containing protein [Dioscorea alata]|uniref:Agenet domain plant type domain-containing protein n=1 Tax=Dioscorea alata TaxID=55571 RepID=A0ACB7VY35_DIOAL|nr:Agenet domain plant type domain-containing protein [Dioscorea alata]